MTPVPDDSVPHGPPTAGAPQSRDQDEQAAAPPDEDTLVDAASDPTASEAEGPGDGSGGSDEGLEAAREAAREHSGGRLGRR
ncbi:hypothetical protein [Azohydromonas caseinilytica]|jgi:hypothetical protein|uniref:Uncharacterized protein n=1 Tax=Azohydromonas caseinilytica TaxID=2728836 RepID=A0A848FK30_9BURK|nr:hypothetical protein [Azohydromonas caseinilytica]NML18593.1 hypothetical protein [Azohydromonas caseinilytica]